MPLEIIIKEVESGDALRIPMAPDEIDIETATRFISFSIMDQGEVKIPNGEELSTISWTSMLPGLNRAFAPYVNVLAWLPPIYFENKFLTWKNKGTKLKLMIPGTIVSKEVYLETYSSTYSGGAGDVKYSVRFCIAKDVIINTEENTTDQTDTDGAAVTTTATPSDVPKTYTVKTGDSLWKIAQSTLGSGSRWREIYDLNKSVIGSNPNLIYAGQVYNLPG